MAALGTASGFMSFVTEHWGSVLLGRRMQDSTQLRSAPAPSAAFTKGHFSYMYMVGASYHFNLP